MGFGWSVSMMGFGWKGHWMWLWRDEWERWQVWDGLG